LIHSGPREIGDGHARLREVTLADAPELYRWRMDPRSRFMFRSTAPVPYESHLDFMARYFGAGNTDRWFVIEHEGEAVGSIVLYDVDAAHGDAEWGRLVIDPDRRGQGHASRALALLVRHARDLGLRRLRCEVLAGNARAEALYREAGFVQTAAFDVDGRPFTRLELDLSGAP
jgi:RimJ/RimL family protein N-acetyltransferase